MHYEVKIADCYIITVNGMVIEKIRLTSTYAAFVRGLNKEDRLTENGKRMVGPIEWVTEFDTVEA